MKRTYTLRAINPQRYRYNKFMCHSGCHAFITFDADTDEQLFTAYLKSSRLNVHHNKYGICLCKLTVDTEQDLSPYMEDLKSHLRDDYLFNPVFARQNIIHISYYKIYDESEILHKILEDPDNGYVVKDLEHSFVIQTPLF